MPREDHIEAEGTVIECLRGAVFKVRVMCNNTELIVTCKLAGKLQKNFIRILEGDNVKIGMSPYDLTKGIITYRNKN